MNHHQPFKISHDISNQIERLRIIHELIIKKEFSLISREEIQEDILLNIDDLKANLLELLKLANTDQ